MTSSAYTAFPETEAHVATLVREAAVDEAALAQPLSRCDLAECHGTCCHDGVYLNADEAEMLRSLADLHRIYFDEELELNLPEKIVVYGRWEPGGNSGPKTATRTEPMSEKVADYPAHFPDTMCVFLMKDGRCGLQCLAEREGLHRWYFKPFTCWMHPLSITAEGEITLYNRKSDPHNFPEYDGFVSQTGCGKIREGCGQPAREVLAEELEMLSQISGRNLSHDNKVV